MPHVHRMTRTALLTALMCLLGPMTLPVGPVPLSLTGAVMMLSAGVFGLRPAVAACGLYLLLGLAGLPVFSGFTGGLMALMGPTGGFLMGYLPLTALCGAAFSRTENIALRALCCILSTALLYALGTAWFCLQSGMNAASATAVCVLPFLPGDALKIAAVLLLAPSLHCRIKRAGLV